MTLDVTMQKHLQLGLAKDALAAVAAAAAAAAVAAAAAAALRR